jgi:hypothetical protein
MAAGDNDGPEVVVLVGTFLLQLTQLPAVSHTAPYTLNLKHMFHCNILAVAIQCSLSTLRTSSSPCTALSTSGK